MNNKINMKYLEKYYKLKKEYNTSVKKVKKDENRLEKEIVTVECCDSCSGREEYELIKDKEHIKLEKARDKAKQKLIEEIEKVKKDCFWQVDYTISINEPPRISITNSSFKATTLSILHKIHGGFLYEQDIMTDSSGELKNILSFEELAINISNARVCQYVFKTNKE